MMWRQKFKSDLFSKLGFFPVTRQSQEIDVCQKRRSHSLALNVSHLAPALIISLPVLMFLASPIVLNPP